MLEFELKFHVTVGFMQGWLPSLMIQNKQENILMQK